MDVVVSYLIYLIFFCFKMEAEKNSKIPKGTDRKKHQDSHQ